MNSIGRLAYMDNKIIPTILCVTVLPILNTEKVVKKSNMQKRKYNRASQKNPVDTYNLDNCIY